MSQDYRYRQIARWETIAGIAVPVDEWGHFLDHNDIRGNDAREVTSPYGALSYAVGTGDDFVCFDFARLPDGSVVLHAVTNSETAHFIEDREYVRCPAGEAVVRAQGMVVEALDWCESGEPPLRLDLKGWSQDPAYFVRCVAATVAGTPGPIARRVRGWRAALVPVS